MLISLRCQYACYVKPVRHPLFPCSKFKELPHDRKMSTLKTHNHCINCLRPGHYVQQSKSVHDCRKCHSEHHILLHNETPGKISLRDDSTPVTNDATMCIKSQSLLMTCRVGRLSLSSPIKSVTSFQVFSTQSPNEKITVTAVIVPKVTCDLPCYHIHLIVVGVICLTLSWQTQSLEFQV